MSPSQDSSLRSTRRAYLEWVEAQIESYKESISRSELLDIADEVIREIGEDGGGQYQLTEILLCDAVDRFLFRRLDLPGYRAWRNRVREREMQPRVVRPRLSSPSGDEEGPSRPSLARGEDDAPAEVAEPAAPREEWRAGPGPIACVV